jgi:hypothetical protein
MTRLQSVQALVKDLRYSYASVTTALTPEVIA